MQQLFFFRAAEFSGRKGIRSQSENGEMTVQYPLQKLCFQLWGVFKAQLSEGFWLVFCYASCWIFSVKKTEGERGSLPLSFLRNGAEGLRPL